MDDALLVRGFDAVDDLAQDRYRVANAHRSAQRFAFDVLHHQVVRRHVVQMTDVGVIQRRNRPRLAGEPFGELDVRYLDRDVAVQPRIVGAIDLAHAAFTDGRLDLVGAECVARGERHESGLILLRRVSVQSPQSWPTKAIGEAAYARIMPNSSKAVLAREVWVLMFDFLMRTSPQRSKSLGRRGLTPNDARALSALDPHVGRTMR